MSQRPFGDTELQQFQEDGYVIVPGLFDAEEVELLLRVARSDETVEGGALARGDGEGGLTKLRIWNEAGEDTYGTVCPNSP